MNRFRKYTVFLSLVIILISGCAQRQAPDPSMTAVGHGGSRGGSADWINSEDITRANELGLGMRDDRFSVGADGGIRDMFPSVLFDFDQSFVRPSDRPALQNAANYLAENRSARMVLEGHCDWRGTTEYNMALGDRRAAAVKNYLVSLGVPDNQLETISKGDLEANTQGNESQMQMDRRVDLIVIPN